MPDDQTRSDNVIAFRKRYGDRDLQQSYLSIEEEARLSELAGEELRDILKREIELGSMRWAREGELLPVCTRATSEDRPVFSASEVCARVALEEAVRSMFWECGEPIPKSDMPIRIVRLQEEFSASLRQILKDLGYV